jgi:hypothetical protein
MERRVIFGPRFGSTSAPARTRARARARGDAQTSARACTRGERTGAPPSLAPAWRGGLQRGRGAPRGPRATASRRCDTAIHGVAMRAPSTARPVARALPLRRLDIAPPGIIRIDYHHDSTTSIMVRCEGSSIALVTSETSPCHVRQSEGVSDTRAMAVVYRGAMLLAHRSGDARERSVRSTSTSTGRIDTVTSTGHVHRKPPLPAGRAPH